MANANFVAEWNDIFDYKIKENELQNPNEKFVFNVLVAYFRKFNMDSGKIIQDMSNPNPEQRRQFKIRFCAYIDHIYKISCAGDKNFLYWDLIKLAPKKIIHMLKTLLNYYYYYKQLQDETIYKIKLDIEKRDSLIKKKNGYEEELNADNKRMKEIEEEIENFKKVFPSLKEELEKLKSTEREQTDKIANLKDTVRNYEAILTQLKCKEDMLKCDLVSDKEIESLTTNKAVLEQAIEEQNEIEKNILSSGNDRKKILTKMEPAINQLQTIADRYPIEELNSFKSMKLKRQQMEQKYTIQKDINEKKKITIQTNLEKLKKYEQIVREKKHNLQDIHKNADTNGVDIIKEIDNKQLLMKKLEQTMSLLDGQLEEKKQYRDFLEDSIEQMVDQMMKLQ